MVAQKVVTQTANEAITCKLNTMLDLVTAAKAAQTKVQFKGIKSAGTTVRNTMQEIKALAQEIRVVSLAQTKSM